MTWGSITFKALRIQMKFSSMINHVTDCHVATLLAMTGFRLCFYIDRFGRFNGLDKLIDLIE